MFKLSHMPDTEIIFCMNLLCNTPQNNIISYSKKKMISERRWKGLQTSSCMKILQFSCKVKTINVFCIQIIRWYLSSCIRKFTVFVFSYFMVRGYHSEFFYGEFLVLLFRSFIKSTRNTNKHILIIIHMGFLLLVHWFYKYIFGKNN